MSTENPTISDKRSVDAKTVLLGASMVGKTSIICRAVSNEFDADTPPTIGASYTAKQIDLENVTVNLQIWDTAGQERFRTLAPMYYRCSIIAVLVFSITELSSLNDVSTWAEEIRNQTDEMPSLFVVGNKLDLESERTVSPEDGQKVAESLGASYFEVSAKTGRGIEELFLKIGEEVSNKLGMGKQAEKPSQNLADSSATSTNKNCTC